MVAAPRLISRPGSSTRTLCVFPEMIAGKYIVFHRVFPEILVSRRETLEFEDDEYLAGEFAIAPRPRLGQPQAGRRAAARRTEEGWLLIYHAVDDRDDSSYKVGAMLLDLADPRTVLYRSPRPILEPQAESENVGHKSGVVYPCGAVVHRRRPRSSTMEGQTSSSARPPTRWPSSWTGSQGGR